MTFLRCPHCRARQLVHWRDGYDYCNSCQFTSRPKRRPRARTTRHLNAAIDGVQLELRSDSFFVFGPIDVTGTG